MERHKATFCQELKYAMVCDNYESTVSIAAPPIPSKIDETFQDDLESIEHHLRFKSKRQEMVDLAEMEFRFLTDRLTGPLTIVYAGSKFGRLANGLKIQDADELVVHIVGSNIIEMLGIIKWEYIIHR